MTKHQLVGNTLVRDRKGIAARCTCGWSSGGHFSSMSASAAMMDHQENTQASQVVVEKTEP
jgi:hypothetical protein